MDFEQAALTAIVTGMLAAFVAGRWRYDVVAMAGLMAAVLAGVVPAGSAFAGFGNPVVITVAAVLVLARTLARSGLVDALAARLLAGSPSVTAQLAVLCGAGAVLSAFMNNIGALALLMPMALSVARRHGRSPSIYLLPLSYATLLGGMSTLIGTPPNLLVSAFRVEAGGEPFGMFAFALVGVPLAAAGVVYLVLVGWRFLPAAGRDASLPGTFLPDGPLSAGEYETELAVSPGSPHAGRPVGELERNWRVRVHGIVRDGRRVFGRLDEERLRTGDLLLLHAFP
ncbi:MAG TPA: SLC13 family permease, partial [Arenibaculum sp.]|nr:SLC13 family permease [Arenibaculum sp.]